MNIRRTRKDLTDPMLQEFLKSHAFIKRKDFTQMGFYTYDIDCLMEQGALKRVKYGVYQVIDEYEEKEEEAKDNSFEKIKESFEQGDIPTLYQQFQNIELTEDLLRKLYPLLLSGIILIHQELKNVTIKSEKQESNILEEETEKAVIDDEKIETEKKDLSEDLEESAELNEITEKYLEDESFEVFESEVFEEEVEYEYSFEEAEKTFANYQLCYQQHNFEEAHQYLLTYIKQCEYLQIPGDYYRRLFNVERSLYNSRRYSETVIYDGIFLEKKFKEYYRKKNIEEAEKCYLELVQLRGEDDPYNDFFKYDLLKAQNHPSSYELALKLCKNFPYYPDSYYLLASCQLHFKQNKKAISTLQNFFKYDLGETNKGDILLIKCYLQQGRYDLANDVFMNAEQYLNPRVLPNFYKGALTAKIRHLDIIKTDAEERGWYPNLKAHYDACKDIFEKYDYLCTEEIYLEQMDEDSSKEMYFEQMENVFASSHNTQDIVQYIDSLELDEENQMEVKLVAAEFLARKKLYNTSQNYITEVERYPQKNAELNGKLEQTKGQLKLIKIQNKH